MIDPSRSKFSFSDSSWLLLYIYSTLHFQVVPSFVFSIIPSRQSRILYIFNFNCIEAWYLFGKDKTSPFDLNPFMACASFGNRHNYLTLSFRFSNSDFLISNLRSCLVRKSMLDVNPSFDIRSIYSNVQPFAVLNSPRNTLTASTCEKPSSFDALFAFLKYLTSSPLLAFTNWWICEVMEWFWDLSNLADFLLLLNLRLAQRRLLTQFLVLLPSMWSTYGKLFGFGTKASATRRWTYLVSVLRSLWL